MTEATVTMPLAEFDAMRGRLTQLESGAKISETEFKALRAEIYQLGSKVVTHDEYMVEVTRVLKKHLYKSM